MTHRRKCRVTFELDESDRATIGAAARREGIPLSQWIRRKVCSPDLDPILREAVGDVADKVGFSEHEVLESIVALWFARETARRMVGSQETAYPEFGVDSDGQALRGIDRLDYLAKIEVAKIHAARQVEAGFRAARVANG